MFEDCYQHTAAAVDYVVAAGGLSEEAQEQIRAYRRRCLHNMQHQDAQQQYIQAVCVVTRLALGRQEMFIGDRGEVSVGASVKLGALEAETLSKALAVFKPWRVGPWNILGCEIDAEWRSEIKWQSILQACPDITNRVVKNIADVGAHNGYYMFRLLSTRAQHIIGFEPVAKHYYAYQLIQHCVQSPRLYLEPFGYEELRWYPKFFDMVFCMGVLYHHRDPIGILRRIHSALSAGGVLILDCQGIAGDEDVAFMPPGRYGGCTGFWWLPTVSCLKNMVRRSGFQEADVFYAQKLLPEEQRSTPWAPTPSLQESLDPHNPAYTVEGHPAPWRFYVKAYK